MRHDARMPGIDNRTGVLQTKRGQIYSRFGMNSKIQTFQSKAKSPSHNLHQKRTFTETNMQSPYRPQQ